MGFGDTVACHCLCKAIFKFKFGISENTIRVHMWFLLWFQWGRAILQTKDSGYTILDFQYQNKIYSVAVAKKIVGYKECIGFKFLI